MKDKIKNNLHKKSTINKKNEARITVQLCTLKKDGLLLLRVKKLILRSRAEEK